MILTDKQRTVLNAFIESGKIRPHNLALKLGHTESAPIYGAITALKKKGYIERLKEGKHVFYQVIPNHADNKATQRQTTLGKATT